MKDLLKKLYKDLTSAIRDDTGSISSMRVLFLGWGLGVLAVWIILCISTASFVSPDVKVFGFILSLVGGKLIQNKQEYS